MVGTGAGAMVGGDGNHSYLHNSSYQWSMFECTKDIMQEIIRTKFDISEKDTIRIVDLGCSVGPNTFYAVETIVEAMSKSLESLAPCFQASNVEFQVFYNDRTDNDFNTLFKTMPGDRRYFAAAVPGSFYSRLFPRCSIHYFHSSMALHWLSRAPAGISNRGRVHICGGGPTILDAYVAQFRADVAAFLSFRAEELAGGGLLSLMFLCRHDDVDLATAEVVWPVGYLAQVLPELFHEGKVKGEDLDSFQVPAYTPTVREFKELVEMDGRFVVHVARMQDDGRLLEHAKHNVSGIEPCELAEHVSRTCRAVYEPLIRAHFGEEVLEATYQRYTAKIRKSIAAGDVSKLSYPTSGIFILQRKPC